jgi:hypothetical protein
MRSRCDEICTSRPESLPATYMSDADLFEAYHIALATRMVRERKLVDEAETSTGGNVKPT